MKRKRYGAIDGLRMIAAFGISLIYNFVCADYFKAGRSNILYSGGCIDWCNCVCGCCEETHRKRGSDSKDWRTNLCSRKD